MRHESAASPIRGQNRLQYRTSYPKLQPVAKHKQFGEAAMGKLIMWNLMTLDGFVEGENRDISWHFDVWGEELERLSIDQLKSAGGLLFGRVTYELMASHWPSATGEVADFMNALPKYVFSRTLTKSDWNNTRMFGADVRGTIERLKRESGKDILLFGSADLAADLMPHRLIDEFRIAVNDHPRRRHAAVQVRRTRQVEAPRRQAVIYRHRHPALRAGKITENCDVRPQPSGDHPRRFCCLHLERPQGR
jgi:dihydrofolate reductase